MNKDRQKQGKINIDRDRYRRLRHFSGNRQRQKKWISKEGRVDRYKKKCLYIYTCK